MSLKRKTMNLMTQFLKTGIRYFGRSKSTLILAKLVEDLTPVISQETEFGTIKFFCPGEIPEWRAQTLLTKEPETIEWINTFSNGDIFWDIGANVGVYTLYAALRGVTVLSFEPSSINYYLLNKNIEINKMDDQVSALCIAFNDTTRLDKIWMANTELGAALNNFADAIDWKGMPFVASFKQAMIGFNIDDFIVQFNPLFPNHIKLDVDGIENKIIKGAKRTLSDKRVKSILVELDSSRTDYYKEVADVIENAGMRFTKEQYSLARGHSGCNLVFVR